MWLSFVKIVNDLLFSQKNSIIDFRLGSKEAFENNKNLKTKLRWSKSSSLLQRLAFTLTLEPAFILCIEKQQKQKRKHILMIFPK